MTNSQKFAVVLMSIGGPDNIENRTIKKYLMNFFSDKFIVRKNLLFRKLIAFIISRSRYKKTQEIYRKIGGKSPIFDNTKAQAEKLQSVLGENFDVYVSMRYWNPLASEVIENMSKKDYEQIILLPMYPQCSSTTTVSAFESWVSSIKMFYKDDEANKILSKTKLICKHFDNEKYLDSVTNLIYDKYQEGLKISRNKEFKLFFSAHSIPEFLVNEEGDPYELQILATVQKIIKRLKKMNCKLEYLITYQSKIGRLKWLEPITEVELIKTAKEKVIPIVVPIAFVSENSETLFELDIDYKGLLKKYGMKHMLRVPTVSCNEIYIEGLADIIRNTVNSISQFPTKRFCTNKKTDCPCIKYENIS